MIGNYSPPPKTKKQNNGMSTYVKLQYHNIYNNNFRLLLDSPLIR